MTESEYYIWMLHTLFWIGVLLVPVGLALIIIPFRVLGAANALNRWISTKPFFDSVNRPRFHERGFYRHHKTGGLLIIVLSAICIYMLGFYSSPQETTAYLVQLMESEFGKWLIVSLYYLLLVSLVIALAIGAVVFFRPSMLKSLENWGNRWIDTDKTLEQLDQVHEIPANILPGRPRWFGLFVLLGALYIVFSTGRMIY